MQFTPKTEKELVEANLIPAKTICDFEVAQAVDTRSKKTGAPMIALKLKVFWNDGYKFVDDYLQEAMGTQLRHFCEAGRLMDKYQDGSLSAEHCKGVCGKVKIKVEDKEDGYPPKNKVMDYVVPKAEGVLAAAPTSSAAAATAATGGNATPPDDDVPF